MLRHLCALSCCCWALAAPALATTYSWTLQSITTSGSQDSVALAMGRGLTWPTVLAGNQDVTAHALSPVGWTQTSLGPRYGPVPTIRAKSGADGQIGGVWATFGGLTFAETSRTGWQATTLSASLAPNALDFGYSSSGKPAVAYAHQGYVKLSAYDGSTWTTEDVSLGTSPLGANYLSMSVDSLDRVGLAFSGGSGLGFAMKDPLTGSWARYTAPQGQSDPLSQVGSINHLSMAFGPNDEAGMLITQSDGFTYAWFDIRSGTWKTERVVQGLSTQGKLSTLIFDSTGAPAFAYIDPRDGGNNIHYRRKVGFGWQDVLLPARGYYGTNVSLAFDAEDLPVIAFRSESSPNYGLMLAYDPIVVPEPACSLLMALGFFAVRRRGN